jgi:hypothetical protein
MTILFQENDTANSIKAFEGLKFIREKRQKDLLSINCQEYFERATR